MTLALSATAFLVLRTAVRGPVLRRPAATFAARSSAFLLAAAMATSTTTNCAASCEELASDGKSTNHLYFDDGLFEYDHYNGVTVHLDTRVGTDSAPETFETALRDQLEAWKQQSIRGVWLHVPAQEADKIAACVRLGFEFHMVLDTGELVLTQWLPEDTPNRLPHGPTHQVGVGCLVWHPLDHHLVGNGSRRMLVVQEKTGPAAAYKLWKMPTGLTDPGEDVHRASVRELMEETGLKASFSGLVAFREAHASKNASPLAKEESKSRETSTRKTAFSRKASDLFFICQLELCKTGAGSDYDSFSACPDEIAAIQWMAVEDYCAQERWGNSPVYTELNQGLIQEPVLLPHKTLPLRHGSEATNTIYYNSKL